MLTFNALLRQLQIIKQTILVYPREFSIIHLDHHLIYSRNRYGLDRLSYQKEEQSILIATISTTEINTIHQPPMTANLLSCIEHLTPLTQHWRLMQQQPLTLTFLEHYLLSSYYPTFQWIVRQPLTHQLECFISCPKYDQYHQVWYSKDDSIRFPNSAYFYSIKTHQLYNLQQLLNS